MITCESEIEMGFTVIFTTGNTVLLLWNEWLLLEGRHTVVNRQAWDLALDHCLAQLPRVVEDNTAFEHSPFFAEQLTAFQVWLSYGSEKRSPPEQLPIVLQVMAYFSSFHFPKIHLYFFFELLRYL